MSDAATLRLAAIDIGTVTTRLLVADVRPGSITEVFRSTDITHLGQDLTSTGRLDPAAMERVAQVMGGYASRMDEHGIVAHLAIATSAARDASNGTQFIELLTSKGVTPQIITGSREAELAFAGATSGVEGDGLLVADLGGGSTELVLGASHSGESVVTHARSLDIGSRRITEMFLVGDPPTTDELTRAREFVVHELELYFEGLPQAPSQMISVAGTATTLAAILARMDPYDAERIHGSMLDTAQLADLLGMLAAMTLSQREGVTGLHPGRAPVIIAGALILGCVLEASGLERTTVSDHDILYGILLDTYERCAKEGR